MSRKPQDNAIYDKDGKPFPCIVSYDYDYGWICETWENGEYEIYDHTDNIDEHTEEARLCALQTGLNIAKNRGGRVLHRYEYPEVVERLHKEYEEEYDNDDCY